MFYRKIEKRLVEYYKDINAKIVVINGARQIGKSFIIRETAKKYFPNYIEINLKSDFDGDQIYKNVKKPKDLYLQLSALFGDKLHNIKDTIVFFDEIQVYPHLLTMLKDLKLENRYRYIASGSLLGVTLKHTFIPMGSIEEIKMYPMDFEEFLYANNVGKDGYEFRAIPKLVNKEGNYKLNKGYIFTNQNICKMENELYTFPIYLIMFV